MKRAVAALAVTLFACLVGSAGFAARPTPAPATRSYNIRLANIHPYATAGRRGDVVYGQISVYVEGALKGSVAWNGLCDDNACPKRTMTAGSYNLGLATSVDTGPLKSTDNVTWSYEIVTSSHAPASSDFDAAAAALATTTCTDPWPCAATGAANVFSGWGFAGCDGVLAVDSVTHTGAFLASHIPSGGEWGYERRYTAEQAARGCGKPDYSITTIVRQVP